jgi:Tol biopolymer transport system component
MDTVFVLDLSGNITASYKISDMTKSDGPSSSDRFVFTTDGKKIVFSSEVNEPGFSDGPPTAVFVYDITGKTTVRLTPKGYYGSGVIVKNNKVLFSGGKIKSTITNVYTVDLDGKNLKVLFPNCWDISAKN